MIADAIQIVCTPREEEAATGMRAAAAGNGALGALGTANAVRWCALARQALHSFTRVASDERDRYGGGAVDGRLSSHDEVAQCLSLSEHFSEVGETVEGVHTTKICHGRFSSDKDLTWQTFVRWKSVPELCARVAHESHSRRIPDTPPPFFAADSL